MNSFKINTCANSVGLINCLLQPGLLLNQPLTSMRANSFQLIKFCCNRTDPAAKTKSIGLQADPAFGEGRRAGALFFAHHLDYFIVTQNSHTLPGLGTVKTVYRDQTTPVHLPGLAKNNAQRHRRHLIKPPGRWRSLRKSPPRQENFKNRRETHTYEKVGI
jgi:hypothetical protein